MMDSEELLPYGLCLAKAALKGLHNNIAISTVCTQSNPKSSSGRDAGIRELSASERLLV